jgi:hypothetical protein
MIWSAGCCLPLHFCSMKINFLILFLLVSTGIAAQGVWTDHSRLLPDRLRNIPEGIIIVHDPTPVYPESNKDTIDYPGKYIWKHQTTVSSRFGDLTVIEAGSYVWWGDRGWATNIKLSPADFSRFFNCPGAILKKGRSFTFLKNWRHGDVIYAGDALWFVLARDKNGKIYKGIAIVETEGTLKTQ